jgi:phosphatidylserine synthase
MAVASDRRESASSQLFVGLALWVAALLVVFFLPAAVKAGRHEVFVSIISVLAAGGLFLIVRGLRVRDRDE